MKREQRIEEAARKLISHMDNEKTIVVGGVSALVEELRAALAPPEYEYWFDNRCLLLLREVGGQWHSWDTTAEEWEDDEPYLPQCKKIKKSTAEDLYPEAFIVNA